MEGTRCSQLGCAVHDFLPFFCPHCLLPYCLEHRGRFVHDCIEDEGLKQSDRQDGIVIERQSVREMMCAVENRFNNSQGQERVHAAGAYSSLPIKEAAARQFQRLLLAQRQLHDKVVSLVGGSSA
eukprot:gene45144-55222_t